MRTGVGSQPVLLSLSSDTHLCMFLHFKHDKNAIQLADFLLSVNYLK